MADGTDVQWLRAFHRSRRRMRARALLMLANVIGLTYFRVEVGLDGPVLYWMLPVGAIFGLVVWPLIITERGANLKELLGNSAHVVRHLNREGYEGASVYAVLQLAGGALYLVAEPWDGTAYFTMPIEAVEVVHTPRGKKRVVRVTGGFSTAVVLADPPCVAQLVASASSAKRG